MSGWECVCPDYTVSPDGYCTASCIGVACAPEHGETREQLVHAADVALYRAKTLGRDRVEVASDRDIREIEVFADPDDASRPGEGQERRRA